MPISQKLHGRCGARGEEHHDSTDRQDCQSPEDFAWGVVQGDLNRASLVSFNAPRIEGCATVCLRTRCEKDTYRWKGAWISKVLEVGEAVGGKRRIFKFFEFAPRRAFASS